MEIRERIESCLNDLDTRRRRIAEFESKVRALMENLRTDGGSTATVSEILEVLSSALENYGEIDVSCRDMIAALSEIGRNQERIEEGRRKIIGGVEKILGHLSQMEALAKQSMVEPKPDQAPGEGSRPRKILLIRLRPPDVENDAAETEIEDLLRADDDLDATIH